jgi:protein TonB
MGDSHAVDGETDGSYAELKRCASERMVDFIYGLQRYPEQAIVDGVSGMAVVSFIIERDGRITSVYTTRSISPEIDSEALYIVDAMAMELVPWRPGYSDGKAVQVQV